VSLDWGTQFSCGANNGTVTGRSTFTFFPDGHINRSDLIDFGAMLDSTMCTCSGGTPPWYLSSFFTVNHGVTSSVFGATLPSDMGTGNLAMPTVCFNGFNNAFQVAMGWRSGYQGRVRTPVMGASGTIAFVYDFIQPGSTSTFGPMQREAQTTMWVGTSSNCTDLRNAVAPYADNSGQSLPTLNIQAGTGAVLSAGVALDGIFGGENGQGSMGYQSAAPDIHLTVDADLGAFAFWLALGSGEEIQSVTKSPMTPTTAWYSMETRNGSNHRLFYFPDGLKTTESITITIQ